VPDLSEVLFNITADGCAFYSIPNPTQPLFSIILIVRTNIVRLSYLFTLFNQICFNTYVITAVRIRL